MLYGTWRVSNAMGGRVASNRTTRVDLRFAIDTKDPRKRAKTSERRESKREANERECKPIISIFCVSSISFGRSRNASQSLH